MENIKCKFEAGDFLKKDNKKGSFMIYEGNNISETSYKRMTLICYYDPEKMVMGAVGYEQKPTLEVATKDKPCETTIDTEVEDYWVKICSEEEKAEALKVLSKYGLMWNDVTMELIDSKSGEVIRKIKTPDNTYYGQTIHPKTSKFKDIIKRYCYSKLKTPTYPYHNPYYNEYDIYD